MAVLIKTMYMPDTCRECELERENWNQWTGSSTHECGPDFFCGYGEK